ncbi:Hypothetical predicted protein [Paramuricea clavata]|uniref:Reverse transcriptase domain-containing protein n=1 Tax=Paramuricea clavata TaxID=317549 RepID=A0A6S7HZQ8_PARCT|nr:Hypothetical predicted protein [Paramuricea clavata]
MKLDPEVKPAIRPPRRIPVSMQDNVKTELERMVKIGVIKPVTEPTSRVSSFVAVKKKGKDEIRLCINPKDLDHPIQQQHYPMRTIEEHQKAMDHLLEGYPCEVIVDDILVWGSTEAEHDKNLLKVRDRIREINLKLKWDKCKFKVKEVGYVGHLTAEGLKPDPEKVRAIVEMQTPKNVKDLQRFLGMICYLSMFVLCLSELALPLQHLLNADVPWTWDSIHQRAFDNLEAAIGSTPTPSLLSTHLSETLPADIYEVLMVQPVGSHKMAELQRETALDPIMVNLVSVMDGQKVRVMFPTI